MKRNLWRISTVRCSIEKYLFHHHDYAPYLYRYLKNTKENSFYNSLISLTSEEKEAKSLEYLLFLESGPYHFLFGSHPDILFLTNARLIIYCIDSVYEYIPLRIDWLALHKEGRILGNYDLSCWIERSFKYTCNREYWQCHILLMGDISCLSIEEKKKVLSQITEISPLKLKVIISDTSPKYNYQKIWPQAQYWIPFQEYIAPNFFQPSFAHQIQHINNLIDYENFATALIAWEKIATKYSKISWMQEDLRKLIEKIYQAWLKSKRAFSLLPDQMNALQECWQKLKIVNFSNWQEIHRWLNSSSSFITTQEQQALMLIKWQEGYDKDQETWLIANSKITDVRIKKIGMGIWQKIHDDILEILEEWIKSSEQVGKRDKLEKLRNSGFVNLGLSSEVYQTSYTGLAYFIYIMAEIFHWKPRQNFIYMGNIQPKLGSKSDNHLQNFVVGQLSDLDTILIAAVTNRPNIENIVISSQHSATLEQLSGKVCRKGQKVLWTPPGKKPPSINILLVSTLHDIVQNQDDFFEIPQKNANSPIVATKPKHLDNPPAPIDKFRSLQAFFYLSLHRWGRDEGVVKDSLFEFLEEKRKIIANALGDQCFTINIEEWRDIQKNADRFLDAQPKNLFSQIGDDSKIYGWLDDKIGHFGWMYDDCAALIFCSEGYENKIISEHIYKIDCQHDLQSYYESEIRFMGNFSLTINKGIQKKHSIKLCYSEGKSRKMLFWLNGNGYEWNIEFRRPWYLDFFPKQSESHDDYETHIIFNWLMFLFMAHAKLKDHYDQLRWDTDDVKKFRGQISEEEHQNIHKKLRHAEVNVKNAKSLGDHLLRELGIRDITEELEHYFYNSYPTKSIQYIEEIKRRLFEICEGEHK